MALSIKAVDVATQLYTGRNAGDMQPALRQIYDYLGVGYLTPDIATQTSGFAIHDFLSYLMAQRYIERQLFPVDRLTRFLGDAGLIDTDTGQPLSAAGFLQLLSSAVAGSRGDDSLFLLSLIDNLGLIREKPLDLTQPGLNPATTFLDPLQSFLIQYDMLIGVDACNKPQPVVPGGLQAGIINVSGLPPSDSIFRRAGKLGKNLGKAGGVAGVAVDSILDALIALGFVITLEPNTAETHWKHSDDESVREVEFRAMVIWDLGEAGKKLSLWSSDVLQVKTDIPKPGKQTDATVVWRADDILIPKNGEWKEGPTSRKTDKEGVAAITFVPKTEKRPNQGPRIEDRGAVEAQVRFRSWIDPRKICDILAVGPINNMAWAGLMVQRHQNLTLEIANSLTKSFERGTWKWNSQKLKIPLQNTDTALEGDGQLITTGTLTGTCWGTSEDKTNIHVKATGVDPLAFTVSFLSGTHTHTVQCPGSDPNTITMPIKGGPDRTFSLPLKDGASYSDPAPPFTGTGEINFTLIEE